MPKEPWEWEEADLKFLITTQEPESLTLDYKAAGALAKDNAKRDEIRKDVSAFANSTGGVIVYGIAEGATAGIPATLDGVEPAQFSSEWLEQVINSNIAPRIQDIRIKSIPLSGPQAGKVAYVVAIPQGHTAHQGPDKKFYKRYNFQNVPMEYYEIIDAMNRTDSPRVEIEMGLTDRDPKYHPTNNTITGSLSVKLQNTGERVAQAVSVQIWVPDGYIGAYSNANHLSLQRGTRIPRNGQNFRGYIYYHKQPHGLFPLFPNVSHEVFDGNYAFLRMTLHRDHEEIAKNDYIIIEVYADNAPVNTFRKSIYELFFGAL